MMAYNYYTPADTYYSNLFGGCRGRQQAPSAGRGRFGGYACDAATHSDPYLRALVDEQAARQNLASAIRREQEARRRLEVEQAQAEARARAQAQAEARARAEAEARMRAAHQQEESRRRAYARAARGAASAPCPHHQG